MSKLIEIDGSEGEGGGQILRTALALSVITGQPFHLRHIRAKRSKPGLMRQHLTCVQAASAVGGESCSAVNDKGLPSALNDQTLLFTPNVNPSAAIKAGNYEFQIGSAGSCALVFQTVLWPLLMAQGSSKLTLRGGTHNSMAPSFTFLDLLKTHFSGTAPSYFDIDIRRHGFYPAGGGEVVVNVSPPKDGFGAIDLMQRGALVQQYAVCLHAGIERTTVERQIADLSSKLGWASAQIQNRALRSNEGPGNVLMAVMQYEQCTHVMTSFSERNRRTQEVTAQIVEEIAAYQNSAAPVGEHLADQLMIPMALSAWQGKPSQIWATEISEHTRTNADIIERFLPIKFAIQPKTDGAHIATDTASASARTNDVLKRSV
jgi:RNA 3'-terminal phosphate cyclase (ATP)